jgi:hypothetical protein
MLAEQDSSNDVESHLQDLRKHALEDRTYQQLLRYIHVDAWIGFPDHQSQSQLPDPCRAYWRVRNLLSIGNSPDSVLSEFHASHQGLRTNQRAQLVMSWPGIDNEIDNHIAHPPLSGNRSIFLLLRRT